MAWNNRKDINVFEIAEEKYLNIIIESFPMCKRSQITIFLIFGLTILIALGFLFYVYNSTKREDVKIQTEKTTKIAFSAPEVNSFLNNCFRNLAYEGIDFISARGGYFYLPKNHYSYGIIKTAYYFYEDYSLFPTFGLIENSISDYMKEYGNLCFEDIGNLTGYTMIEHSIENVTVTISKGRISIFVNSPTKISIGNNIQALDTFLVEIDNIRLYDVYNFNDYLIKEQAQDKYSICLSCIMNKGTENNFFTDVTNTGNNTLLFTIMYNDTKSNYLHKFIFANKYRELSCSKLPIDADENFLTEFTENCARQAIESYNYSLLVEDTEPLQAYVGVPFKTKIEAKGYKLEFKDYTDLFDINSTTGIINFIPSDDEAGEHLELISIKDKFDNEKLIVINITVSSLTQ